MPLRCECDLIGCDGGHCLVQSSWSIELGGEFIGRVEAYRKPRRPRLGGGLVAKAVYFCILPNGKRTEFALPTRKQAIEWLMQAQEAR